MAILGKIRSKGVLLIGIIGLGLFAFIAEEFFRSCETTKNDQRQQVGEVLGEKINIQEFQALIDEYTEVIKLQQGQENLNDEQMDRVKDMVWNTFVQTKILEHETERLGITVTDAEVQNILNQGTNPMLTSTPFINQQTGRFDANSLKKFIADYKAQKAANSATAAQYEPLYKYWLFLEKNLRRQLLTEKYQNLFAQCLITNGVVAQMAYKDANEESKVNLAVFPYESIQNSTLKYNDSELSAKYNEQKERFRQYIESRDIKYIDVKVTASAKDRAALDKEFAGYATELAAAENPAELVRKSMSEIAYLGVPVTKDAFPFDISRRIDSVAVGATSKVIANAADNTLNLIKIVSKTQLPDSIQMRQIQVPGNDLAEIQKRADSIYVALKGGADFELIAKQYGQAGEKFWMTTRQYQSAPSMDEDTRNYINTINTLPVNELRNFKLTQGNIIVQVVDRRAMVTKYVAAVIKRNIDFSRDTYSAAYNKFSSFVSANQNSADLLKNAKKSGYTVLDRKNMTTADHNVAGIRGTHEALKWVFDAAEGDISPMYECGDNDHLLVAVVDKIHKKGFRTLDDAEVNEEVKNQVLLDKKAEQLMAKAKDVKSVDDAKAKGATVSQIDQVTFNSPVFIPALGASEQALSGAVSATAKGKFSAKPVKGQTGVFVFQVMDKKTRPGKYDEKSMRETLHQNAMRAAGNFMNELYLKANVVDNRYLFF